VKIYTYQLGSGADGNIDSLAHSETVYADGLAEAGQRARAITSGLASLPSDANIVRLLEHIGDDVQLMWWRPTSTLLP